MPGGETAEGSRTCFHAGARGAHRGRGRDAGAEPPDGPPEGDLRDRQISRLKQQLADAKRRFLSEMEARQTSWEESQNTAEETLSANEELQSLNEETGRPPRKSWQSTNEELITVKRRTGGQKRGADTGARLRHVHRRNRSAALAGAGYPVADPDGEPGLLPGVSECPPTEAEGQVVYFAFRRQVGTFPA